MLCIFLHGVCLEFVFFSFLLIGCSLHVLDWYNWNIQHPISNQHFATESSDSKNRTARYSHNAMIYLSLEIPCFVSLFFSLFWFCFILLPLVNLKVFLTHLSHAHSCVQKPLKIFLPHIACCL